MVYQLFYLIFCQWKGKSAHLTKTKKGSLYIFGLRPICSKGAAYTIFLTTKHQENTWQMNFVIYQRIIFHQIVTQILNVWYSCLPAMKIGKLRSVCLRLKTNLHFKYCLYKWAPRCFFHLPLTGRFGPKMFRPLDVSAQSEIFLLCPPLWRSWGGILVWASVSLSIHTSVTLARMVPLFRLSHCKPMEPCEQNI